MCVCVYYGYIYIYIYIYIHIYIYTYKSSSLVHLPRPDRQALLKVPSADGCGRGRLLF